MSIIPMRGTDVAHTHDTMYTGVSTQSTHDMIAQYIRTLVMQYFNKEKADAILMNEDVCVHVASWGLVSRLTVSFIISPSQTAPDWLDMMISEPMWRALLCELSEIHPDSFMLKFSIQVCAYVSHEHAFTCGLLNRMPEPNAAHL